jgi:CheY-like chemotaxis protein
VFPAERQRCIQAGMDDYLGKPFNREALHRILVSCMPGLAA